MAVLVLMLLAAYVAFGVVFAAIFLTRGVHMLDHAVRGAPPAFHALISPGVVALWPVLVRKWLRARSVA